MRLVEPYKFGKEYEFGIECNDFLNKMVLRDTSGPYEVSSPAYNWYPEGILQAPALECGLINLAGADRFFDYYYSGEKEQKGNHFHYSYYCPNSEEDLLFTINTYTTLGLVLRHLLASRNRFRNTMPKYSGDCGFTNVLGIVLHEEAQTRYCFTNVVEYLEEKGKYYVHLEFRASEYSVIYDYALIDFINYLMNGLNKDDYNFIRDYKLMRLWSIFLAKVDVESVFRFLRARVREFFEERVESRKIPKYITFPEIYIDSVKEMIKVLDKVNDATFLPCFYVEMDEYMLKEAKIEEKDIERFIYGFNKCFEPYGFVCDVQKYGDVIRLIFWGSLKTIHLLWFDYYQELKEYEYDKFSRILKEIHYRAVKMNNLDFYLLFASMDEEEAFKEKNRQTSSFYYSVFSDISPYIVSEMRKVLNELVTYPDWKYWV